MAERGARSIGATVVGWLIVGVIAWFLFGSIFGTVRFLLRIAFIALIVIGLLWVYFRLKAGPDD